MTTEYSSGLKLDDSERLPWLEPAEDEEEEVVSPLRIAGLVLLGLLLLGLIVGGGYWLRSGAPSAPGDAKLIAAQGGDYKLPANAAGKTFDGEGDASYAASEGVERDGRVDQSRAPEQPMADVSPGSIARERGAVASSGKPASQVTAAVKDETGARAPKVAAATGASGGAMIQLGAFGSDAGAREVWKKLSGRFDYLAGLSSEVEKADVNGTTYYRLRAGAGSAADAATICGRLKVAGENCIVVR